MEALLVSVVSAITDFFSNLIKYIGALIVNIFTAFFVLLKDVFFGIFESILQLITFLVSGIDFGFITSLNYIALLPPDLINIMALVGAGEALAIITGAITVRLIMQLIPFVRLGS